MLERWKAIQRLHNVARNLQIRARRSINRYIEATRRAESGRIYLATKLHQDSASNYDDAWHQPLRWYVTQSMVS